MGPGPFDYDVTSYPVLRVPIQFESDCSANSTRRSEQHAGSPSQAQHLARANQPRLVVIIDYEQEGLLPARRSTRVDPSTISLSHLTVLVGPAQPIGSPHRGGERVPEAPTSAHRRLPCGV
jgi:hypothetical protein